MPNLPCLDSPTLAESNRSLLNIHRDVAAELGCSALTISEAGAYLNDSGETVDIRVPVSNAIAAKISLPGDAPLPHSKSPVFPDTSIQVANETTLAAARRLLEGGCRPLILNFANGIQPGGGFLTGARAQEESLCRSSALFLTLVADPMYAAHRKRSDYESSDWCILSPVVPVFRDDAGLPLNHSYLLDFITSAAPVGQRVGQPRSADLLRARIHRVLAIAKAYGYETLILGAWGCGAFGNDPKRTAADFRHALETDFRCAFSKVVFAITDWSPERKFLGPFRDMFAAQSGKSDRANLYE
jgi:uncharacterized protein (TIGR02452 family)